MEEKRVFIQRGLDRILREWSSRCALLGAGIILALSLLDFFSTPDLALRFLCYRVIVGAFLVASALLMRRAQSRAKTQLLIFLGVAAPAVAVEAMILDFGGHRSPYLIGQILIGVLVAGLIPTGAGFAALLLGTVFLVYLVPILLWDTITEPDFFAVNTALFVCVLLAAVLVRWFQMRHLVREMALRHDLTVSRESLELEVARRDRIATELSESREFLFSITASAMDAIVMIDADAIVRYWNPAAAGIFGYEEREVLGRGPFSFLVAPEHAAALLADYRAWQATGASAIVGRRIVSRGLRKSGESFPMELAIAAVPRAGRIWACALLTDITERTGNEEQLRLFAAAVEAAAEGIFIVDFGGKILYVNTSAAEQSGHTPADLMGKNIRQLHRNPVVLENHILPMLKSVGRWSGEVPGYGCDGRHREYWLTASLVRDAMSRPIAMVGLTRDLADQKKLEAEHVRAQKIESIGVLAGGLAHDFNNLLTIILGNLDLARLFGGSNPDLAEALDHAGEAASRAGDLTRQLITFSKGGQPVKRVDAIVPMVRTTVLFAATGSSLACEFNLPENLPLVDFDEGQIRQVIHNLVQNAREATPEGGTLRVSARALRLADGEVPGLSAGGYLRLEFTDEGTGISQEHLTRIFDPYFSTKTMDAVKGRGLGLAVSYSIVRNHGGVITAESQVGKGTTVAVYLPEASDGPEAGGEEEDADDAPAPQPAASRWTAELERMPEGPQRGRVLVMDDELLVLDMAGAMLHRLGYAATLTRSGDEAIVKYQVGLEAGRGFDAVILDLTVPGGIGGPETLTRLRQIDPDVRAVLSSGYSEHPAVSEWAASGFKAFIAKPYSMKAFEDLLATLA